MTFIYFFSLTLFIMLCGLLCFIILIQESKTTGLGSSFGGDAGSSVFGTSTADVLKKFTSWVAIIFFASCIILSIWTAALGNARKPSAPPSVEQTNP